MISGSEAKKIPRIRELTDDDVLLGRGKSVVAAESASVAHMENYHWLIAAHA